MNNIALLHKDCGDQRHLEWQEANKDLNIKEGEWCKMAFKEDEKVEHMWVLVKEANNETRTYKGILDNDPLFLTNMSLGDQVEFEFGVISDVYKG